MKTFIVGGFVRDTLLGITPKDRDWVAVDTTPQQMLDLGFSQVGKDFPVFLHPKTREEYALARTERKIGHGYKGFAVSMENVTLEKDLSRRDLTINAMAMDETGTLVDPFNGAKDLAERKLRHVSAAFAEDPLRVLRLARFLAKLGPDWSVAPETLHLVKEMVAGGELDHLYGERIWLEIEKGLLENHPERMVTALVEWNVLSRKPFGEYQGALQAELIALRQAVACQVGLEVRFALAFPGNWDREMVRVSRVPANVREVSHLLNLVREFGPVRSTLSGEVRLKLLESLDALRQQARFEKVVQSLSLLDVNSAQQLALDVLRLRQLNYGKLAQDVSSAQVKNHIREAKIAALSCY
jgi:tRNA nucleotidyltransferase (CCA-adding enzyme)